MYLSMYVSEYKNSFKHMKRSDSKNGEGSTIPAMLRYLPSRQVEYDGVDVRPIAAWVCDRYSPEM